MTKAHGIHKTLTHWRTGLSAFFLAICSTASSQTAPAPDADHLVYQLQPGDTFLGLVAKYMQGPDALKRLILANKLVNVNRISVGYKINIPRDVLKHTPATATVTRLNCKSVIQIDGNASVPIQMGTVLREGAELRIPAGCHVALTLEDDSMLRLMSGAVIQIKTLRRNAFETSPEVKIELLNGRMEIDVPRKRQSNDAPFQVLTPTSVAGVRGTEFRVGFDARQRTSQVEVKVGTVGARGGQEKSEKLAQKGEGVAIAASGQSLDIEKLLSAPRYSKAEAQRYSKDWLLKFDADPLADHFMLLTAEDANFSAPVTESQPKQSQVLAPELNVKPVFYQWATVSASGLMGSPQDYAVCKGYKRLEQWRCNVPFNMEGFNNPHLHFQKVDPQGQTVDLINGLIQANVNKLLVFRGLPSGVYRWRIQHDVSASMKTAINGQFELVAIPGKD